MKQIYRKSMDGWVRFRAPAALLNLLKQKSRRRHRGITSRYVRDVVEAAVEGLVYCPECGHKHALHYQPERKR